MDTEKYRAGFEHSHCGGNRKLIVRNSTTGEYVSPSMNDAFAGYVSAKLESETFLESLLANNHEYHDQLLAARAKSERMEAALQTLVDHACLSDDSCYGTLATSFVRDIASAATAPSSQSSGTKDQP